METSRPAPGTSPPPDLGSGSDAGAQRRLELLVEANRAILGELSLTAVLRQIVSSARELVGAHHAALEVLGPDGERTGLVQVGTDGEPTGPAGASRTSLAVPVKVRDVVYGHLHVADRAEGGDFAPEDRTTLEAFGVSAGIAIENARLFEESGRRQLWAEAAAAVSSALLDPGGGTDPVALIADTVLRLTGADAVSVVVPVDGLDAFRVRLARGVGAEGIEGLVYPARQSVAALAIATGRGVRLRSPEDEASFFVHLRRALDVGAVLGLPLHGSATSHGALVVARLRGRPAFDRSDLELGQSFAAQAAIAMELAEARAAQQRLVVLQDRERIARDLHDHVIQRLFAAGLTLEGLAGSLDAPAAARLVSVVEDLDVTIRQIRNLIFRLQPVPTGRTLRSAVLEVVAEAAPVLGSEPDVAFVGPVDTVADEALVDDVVAVVREALSNVVRHARARHVALTVSATAAELAVVVSDDGRGAGGVARRSGLDNLAQRAARHGGTSGLSAGPTGGTELRWVVPLR
ncbi:GAF domain-containing protein [Microlunatus spumicola]|uniref:GAF domain-containing protein n=1 Tax=Microlunatus spumicola TaxID=81499 RepID=UPI00195D2852